MWIKNSNDRETILGGLKLKKRCALQPLNFRGFTTILMDFNFRGFHNEYLVIILNSDSE